MNTALLVGLKGVNPARYNGWDGTNGCAGCELDVDNVAALLKPLSYGMNILKTSDATATRVLEELKRAAQTLKSGDTFVFYYSGHGGQQPDTSGDETDGQDETLVAYDRQIIDDELNDIWLSFKPGVRIIMLSDSCNSGTNYKGIVTINRNSPIVAIPNLKAASEMRAQMIHFGGCRDGGTSAGYADGGAFTKALCKVMAGGAFKGTYRMLYSAIVPLVTTQVVQYDEYGPVTDQFRNQVPFSSSDSKCWTDINDRFQRGIWRTSMPIETFGTRDVSVDINLTIRAASQEDLKSTIENQLGNFVISEIARNGAASGTRSCTGSIGGSFGSGGGSIGGNITCTW